MVKKFLIGIALCLTVSSLVFASTQNDALISKFFTIFLGTSSNPDDVYLGEGTTQTKNSPARINTAGARGTNVNGQSLILAGGKATGNATGGGICFQTSDPGSSGSTLQTLSNKMCISDAGDLTVSGSISTGSGGLNWDDNESLVVTGTEVNFHDPDSTNLVTNSPSGTAKVNLSQYALLDGRSGGQTINGGTAVNQRLYLQPTIDSSSSFSEVAITKNFFGGSQLIIGGETDPIETAFGIRLPDFMVESNGTAAGGTIFGAWTANDILGPGFTSLFVGIASRGTMASPTDTQDGDALFQIEAQGWPIGQPAGQISFFQDGTTSSGQVPTDIHFDVGGPSGQTLRPVLNIEAKGFITMADDVRFKNPVSDFSSLAQLHVRGTGANNIVQILQEAPSQASNISEWWPSRSTTLAANANVSDTTLTLTDSSKMASTGDVVVNSTERYTYTANNTSTGVLTLSGSVTHNRGIATPVYGMNMIPMTVVDKNGNVGIGNSVPSTPLEVNGVIHSDSGGIQYPNGDIVAAGGLTGLTDIGSDTKTAGNILVADGTKFQSVPISGDCTLSSSGAINCSGGGGGGASALTGLTDVSTDYSVGKIIIADGSSFVGQTVNGDATMTSSGELTIVNGAITSIKMSDTGVVPETYGSAAITVDSSGRILNASAGSLTGLSDVGSETPTAGNILVADGTKFQSVSLSGDLSIDSSGIATVTSSQYLLLAGRSGSANNAEISTDSDGSITGSGTGNHNLILFNNSTQTVGTAEDYGINIDGNQYINQIDNNGGQYRGLWWTAPLYVDSSTNETINSFISVNTRFHITDSSNRNTMQLFYAKPIFNTNANEAMDYFTLRSEEIYAPQGGSTLGVNQAYALSDAPFIGENTSVNYMAAMNFNPDIDTNGFVSNLYGLYDRVHNDATNGVGTRVATYVEANSGGQQLYDDFGLYMENDTVGNIVAVIRSVVTAGSGKYLIYDTGGAQSVFKGNVGIGSTALPTASLLVNGHIHVVGTAPTIANNDCGTTSQGTVSSKSTDVAGSITAGTLAVTSCALTFNATWANAPFCVAIDDSNVLAIKASSTTTKLTITSTTSMSSDVISYICIGGQ